MIRKTAVIILTFGICIHTNGQVKSGAQELLDRVRSQSLNSQVSVCRVQSFGRQNAMQGTGFLALSYSPLYTVLFTAKHIVENQDSLSGTVLCYTKESGFLKPLNFTIPLYPNGKRSFFVPDTAQDGAAILIPDSLLSTEKLGINLVKKVIARSDYVPFDSVFVGLPVLVVGYPLGIAGELQTAVIRKGSVAARSANEKTLLLEADVFPGSSGSAVFVDISDPVGDAFVNLYGQQFVGLVWGYRAFRKQYVNTQDPSDKLSMSENSGLSLVISADILARFIDELRSRQN